MIARLAAAGFAAPTTLKIYDGRRLYDVRLAPPQKGRPSVGETMCAGAAIIIESSWVRVGGQVRRSWWRPQREEPARGRIMLCPPTREPAGIAVLVCIESESPLGTTTARLMTLKTRPAIMPLGQGQ